MKTMIKAYQPANGAIAHVVVDASMVDAMNESLRACGAEAKAFCVGKMPLDELPADVQDEVKNILKVYANANVVFEYNRFEVSAHSCIKAHYNYDHFVCGRYSADEVYTKEERAQHLQELNSCDFPEWAW